MTAPNPLNTEIRNRLDKEFRDKQFTSFDFDDIIAKCRKTRKDVSSCLHKLQSYKLLDIVKRTPNPSGGGAIKTFKVVKGASFEIKHGGTIKKEACEKIRKKEKKNALACRRLVRAMDNFVQVWY